MDELVNNEFAALHEAVANLMEVDDGLFTDEVMQQVKEQLDLYFSPKTTLRSVHQLVQDLENQGINKQEARASVAMLKQLLQDQIFGQYNNVTGPKQEMLKYVEDQMNLIFDQAVEMYHSYAIELPMVLDEGAQMPTYAHEGDAAADLYALEDTDLNAHTYGNLIRTGVHIQLPEGWLALVLPRSGMSKNTPFRVSNAPGLIDSNYRGDVGVLIDNTSEHDSFIHKGDRIAQLLVMPSYRFKAKIVDSLEDSDRGEAGFGSTGV